MDEKNLLHRDDVPMEMAEEMVARLKTEFGEEVKIQFIGDMTDAQKSAMPEIVEEALKLNKHLDRCFFEGLCHICETRFPGEWPPPDDGDDDWFKGWAWYDTETESDQPPMLVCPVCEEADSDGQARPVILPE